MNHVNKFEEYKLFVEDTARFSERRQKVGSTYVAVNSIILSAIALKVKDSGLAGRWQLLTLIPLLVVGIAICSSWVQLILNYKKLVYLSIGNLREMEELPEMSGSVQMYHAEDGCTRATSKTRSNPAKVLTFPTLSGGCHGSSLDCTLCS